MDSILAKRRTRLLIEWLRQSDVEYGVPKVNEVAANIAAELESKRNFKRLICYSDGYGKMTDVFATLPPCLANAKIRSKWSRTEIQEHLSESRKVISKAAKIFSRDINVWFNFSINGELKELQEHLRRIETSISKEQDLLKQKKKANLIIGYSGNPRGSSGAWALFVRGVEESCLHTFGKPGGKLAKEIYESQTAMDFFDIKDPAETSENRVRALLRLIRKPRSFKPKNQKK